MRIPLRLSPPPRKAGSAIVATTLLVIAGLAGAWQRNAQSEAQIANELDRLGAIMAYAWRWDVSVEFLFSADGPRYWLLPGDATITRVNLSFSYEQCIDEKLTCLKSLRNLRCLGLINAPITDKALPHVAGVASLEELYLSHTPITDQGLRNLETCSHLTRLDLSNTRITDAGIPHLVALSQLKWISLHGTQISAKGIALLRQQLPATQIASDWAGNSRLSPGQPQSGLACASMTWSAEARNVVAWPNPKDLVTDGQSLWVVNDASTDKVFKYSTAGSLAGRWTIDSANRTPTGQL
jgi:hypothetical protein